MQARTSRLALIALAPMVVAGTTGCATKGFVRQEVETQRQALAAQRASIDSVLTNERLARIAGDSANSAQIDAMRRGLDSLRTEFGAKITAMESALQFAFPVTFAFDDAGVREEARPALERFAQIAQRHYPGALITVEGFADPAGSVRYNLDLSRRRAQTVRDFLVQQGLDTKLVQPVGYGEARQVVPGAERDEPGGEQNRRVVFVVEARGMSTDRTVGVAIQPQPPTSTP